MPHPPGALKTTEEVKQAIARQGHLWGVLVGAKSPLVRKFTEPTQIPVWWNLDGLPVRDDDKHDFLFANYFHAFAYACKMKGRV